MKKIIIKLLRFLLRKLNGKYEMSLNEFYSVIEKYAADQCANHFEVAVIKSPQDKEGVRFKAYVAGHCYTTDSKSVDECIVHLNEAKKKYESSEVTNVVF